MDAFINWFTESLPRHIGPSLELELVRYAAGTLGVFFVVWVLLSPWLKSRKIRPPTPRRRQITMELLNSFKSICVYIALDIVVFDIAEIGVFQKYNDVALYGWLWFWASIPVAIILHDAYFYWMHRAMHHPKLYKIFHLTHHRSHNPTPFTAYSFSAPEAAVQYAFVPLLLLVMPIHSVALLIVLAIMILKNAVGHCGYELFPRGFAEHPVWGQFTTVTHHDMHHERARGNYGFYFTWWDRWMGTEQADYQTRFARVTQPETQHGGGRSACSGAEC